MSEPHTLQVFLSYAHPDKRVARRLVRSFAAYGLKVWLDERELRAGAELPSSIRAHMRLSGIVLVIASRASAETEWVERELHFARDEDKRIVPLFIEPVINHPRFCNYLGHNVTRPTDFADVVYSLMRDIFARHQIDMPAVDPALLTAGLRELAKQEPAVAPLIHGSLDTVGLQLVADSVFSAAFHALDEALNALFELRPSESIHLVAEGFGRAGAGARALCAWIGATGDGGLPLVSAVGRVLDSSVIPRAIQLLHDCEHPNDHALYMFISNNSLQLDAVQRATVIRMVTWPARMDREHGDVLGWVAMEKFPEATDIQQMWIRWIDDGLFDRKPAALADYLADAHKESLPGWSRIHDTLRAYLRGLLRSGNRNRVCDATEYIKASANAGAPILAALLLEARSALGTVDWSDWRVRDPDAAEWTYWYVHGVAQEAESKRDWLRAWDNAEQMVAFQKERLRILGEE